MTSPVTPADSASPASLPPEPDAHGQAALLLAESILHALVSSSTLTNEDAITVVRIAAEVKEEVAMTAGESAPRMRQSLELLSDIEATFRADRLLDCSSRDSGYAFIYTPLRGHGTMSVADIYPRPWLIYRDPPSVFLTVATL